MRAVLPVFASPMTTTEQVVLVVAIFSNYFYADSNKLVKVASFNFCPRFVCSHCNFRSQVFTVVINKFLKLIYRDQVTMEFSFFFATNPPFEISSSPFCIVRSLWSGRQPGGGQNERVLGLLLLLQRLFSVMAGQLDQSGVYWFGVWFLWVDNYSHVETHYRLLVGKK